MAKVTTEWQSLGTLIDQESSELGFELYRRRMYERLMQPWKVLEDD